MLLIFWCWFIQLIPTVISQQHQTDVTTEHQSVQSQLSHTDIELNRSFIMKLSYVATFSVNRGYHKHKLQLNDAKAFTTVFMLSEVATAYMVKLTKKETIDKNLKTFISESARLNGLFNSEYTDIDFAMNLCNSIDQFIDLSNDETIRDINHILSPKVETKDIDIVSIDGIDTTILNIYQANTLQLTYWKYVIVTDGYSPGELKVESIQLDNDFQFELIMNSLHIEMFKRHSQALHEQKDNEESEIELNRSFFVKILYTAAFSFDKGYHAYKLQLNDKATNTLLTLTNVANDYMIKLQQKDIIPYKNVKMFITQNYEYSEYLSDIDFVMNLCRNIDEFIDLANEEIINDINSVLSPKFKTRNNEILSIDGLDTTIMEHKLYKNLQNAYWIHNTLTYGYTLPIKFEPINIDNDFQFDVIMNCLRIEMLKKYCQRLHIINDKTGGRSYYRYVSIFASAITGIIVIIVFVKRSYYRNNTNSSVMRGEMNDMIPHMHASDGDNIAQISDRLMRELNRYYLTMHQNTPMIDDINITQILDDFHEIMHYTQTKLMSDCQANICRAFERNYRDRSNLHTYNFKQTEGNNPSYAAKVQILDKIHCFYQHPITPNVTENQDFTESKNNLNIVETIKQKMIKKYNQLYANETEKFMFGYEFIYMAKDDYEIKSDVSQKHLEYRYVKQKYKSLKEEMIDNTISTIHMSLDQYLNEYRKSQLHYDSQYRKRKYAYDNILLEHLLVLLIYCNYDQLQTEFSKTYRENNGMNHNHFYHFGKLLQEAVIKHGVSIDIGEIKRFYHGVNRKLVPAQIVGDLGKGIRIFCPLSTSSSQAVAINFSDGNQGLVMTFGGQSKAKYFSVDWLSDYAHEKEHLFLQNKEEIKIINIMDCGTGFEFKLYLNVLKTMDAIFCEAHYFVDETSKQQTFVDFIIDIMHHQLSIKKILDLDEYAQKLFTVYLDKKVELSINYHVLEQKYGKIFKLICLTKYEWINLDKLRILFPNIENIEIKNIKLCDEIMENISENRSVFRRTKNRNKGWKLKKMTLRIDKSSSLKCAEALAKYKERFKDDKDIKLVMTGSISTDDKYDTIFIE
eukprot:275755_1